MKGTFFQKPFEFQLSIAGEAWNQGEPVDCTLTVKNHGAEPVPLADFRVMLAEGVLRKVRAKAPGAFEILSVAGFPPTPSPITLQPGAQESLSWRFETDRNCPVTDVTGSLFVLYGHGDAAEALGQLQLLVRPHVVIQEFIKTLEVDFRFVTKTVKSAMKGIEIKLAPPQARGFVTLDSLVLALHLEDRDLHVQYAFNLKKIEATAATFDVKKERQELRQVFLPQNYLLASGRINSECFQSSLKTALEGVQAKVLF